MAQILDLGNVMGPAGPSKITSSTETDMTGILFGVNGRVVSVEEATPEEMAHFKVPELVVQDSGGEDRGKLSADDRKVTLSGTGGTSSAMVTLDANYVGASYENYSSLVFEAYGSPYCNLYPSVKIKDSNGKESDGASYLGTPARKWTYGYIDTVYTSDGTVQTSDRAAKDDIRYLVDESTPMMMSLTEEDTDTATPAAITVGDVMDFVRNLAPVTFCYKNGAESASEDTASPESIQLGLIANDIENHPLFKYVGVKSESGLGLQAIPLATVALTACKKLTEELDSVNARLAVLEMKMETLLSKEDA